MGMSLRCVPMTKFRKGDLVVLQPDHYLFDTYPEARGKRFLVRNLADGVPMVDYSYGMDGWNERYKTAPNEIVLSSDD